VAGELRGYAMVTRTILKRLALVAAAWLLVAQASFAAASCMMLLAGAPAQSSQDGMAMVDCPDGTAGQASCVVHCLQAEQAVSAVFDHAAPSFAPVISITGYLKDWPPPDSSVTQFVFPQSRGSPPLQVLFCSFQI
jgi:hypothetical protein